MDRCLLVPTIGISAKANHAGVFDGLLEYTRGLMTVGSPEFCTDPTDRDTCLPKSIEPTSRGLGVVDLQVMRTSQPVQPGDPVPPSIQVALGNFSVIGGGAYNMSSGLTSVVAGGNANSAVGESSTVGGGTQNYAVGNYSVIPGGRNASVTGTNSFGFRGRGTAGQTTVAQNNTAVFDVDRFGVGTAAPSEQLDVRGAAGATTAIALGKLGNPSASNIVYSLQHASNNRNLTITANDGADVWNAITLQYNPGNANDVIVNAPGEGRSVVVGASAPVIKDGGYPKLQVFSNSFEGAVFMDPQALTADGTLSGQGAGAELARIGHGISAFSHYDFGDGNSSVGGVFAANGIAGKGVFGQASHGIGGSFVGATGSFQRGAPGLYSISQDLCQPLEDDDGDGEPNSVDGDSTCWTIPTAVGSPNAEVELQSPAHYAAYLVGDVRITTRGLKTYPEDEDRSRLIVDQTASNGVQRLGLEVISDVNTNGEGMPVSASLGTVWPQVSGTQHDFIKAVSGAVADDAPASDDWMLEGSLGVSNTHVSRPSSPTNGIHAAVYGSATGRSDPSQVKTSANFADDTADQVGVQSLWAGYFRGNVRVNGGLEICDTDGNNCVDPTVQQDSDQLWQTGYGNSAYYPDDVKSGSNITADGYIMANGPVYGSAKYFIAEHPNDPTKLIRYTSLEGPEAGTYVRGSASLTNGSAIVPLPSHFSLVTAAVGLTAQITPTSATTGLYVAEKSPTQIIVRQVDGGSGSGTFDYLVQGVRKGYENEPVIIDKTDLPRSAGIAAAPATQPAGQEQNQDAAALSPDAPTDGAAANDAAQPAAPRVGFWQWVWRQVNTVFSSGR